MAELPKIDRDSKFFSLAKDHRDCTKGESLPGLTSALRFGGPAGLLLVSV
jgi:hypothetical protein